MSYYTAIYSMGVGDMHTVIEQETQDLTGLLEDLYCRMREADRSSAGAVADLLRRSAASFEQLDQEDRHGA